LHMWLKHHGSGHSRVIAPQSTWSTDTIPTAFFTNSIVVLEQLIQIVQHWRSNKFIHKCRATLKCVQQLPADQELFMFQGWHTPSSHPAHSLDHCGRSAHTIP
jgi:hypothetical protein